MQCTDVVKKLGQFMSRVFTANDMLHALYQRVYGDGKGALV